MNYIHWKNRYNKYIKSDMWKQKSKCFKQLASWKCQKCGSTERLTTHHLNYDCLFNETEKDIIVLCVKCHRLKHPKRKLTREEVKEKDKIWKKVNPFK